MTKLILGAIAALAAILLFVPTAVATTIPVPPSEAIVLNPTGTQGTSLYVHGAGGNAATLGEPKFESMVRDLIGAGFTVASTDGGGAYNWGRPFSVRAYEEFAAKLPKPIYLIAESMGGLDAMQLLKPLHVQAMAMLFPVCNIEHLIHYKIGESALEEWGSLPQRLSPVLPSAAVPTMIWASPEDTFVPKVYNADVCARELSEDGASVKEFSTHGQHGDASNYRGAWVTRFFLAN